MKLQDSGYSISTDTEIRKHYEIMPMQYTAIFHGCKHDNFQMKECDIFFYFCSKHRAEHEKSFITSVPGATFLKLLHCHT